MRTLFEDLRFGLRILRRSPGFAGVAVLTLALGIAASTTVFSWVDGLLLHPFPGAGGPGRLAVIETIKPSAPNGANQLSYLDYRDYRDSLKSISGLAVHREDVFALGDASDAEAVWGEVVSGNYFAVLGVKPALGRVFSRAEYDDKPGAYPVAVISYRLWRSRFLADPAVLGKKLRVNRHELTIVGVASPEFRGTMPGLAFDVWVPLSMGADLGLVDASIFRSRGYRNLYVIARLKPGVTIAQANAEMTTAAANLALTYPQTNRGVSATVEPAWRFHSGAPELLLGPLRILMVVSVLVMLIVCANIANLLLARAVSRQKEFGIRIALGAMRRRLARQLFTETLLLSVAGALAGLPLAFWMAESLPSLVPPIGAPVAASFQLNGRVMAFTMLTCVCAALLSGMAPVLFSSRTDLNETLKQGGRGGSSGAHSHRARGLLVATEVALAAVALIGAGLFVRSFRNAESIYPGFDRDHVLLARFYPASTSYSVSEIQQFCLRLRERLRSDPSIADVNYADFAPLGSNAGPYHTIQVQGYVPAPGESMEINRSLVAPGHFRLLRTPLVEGRDFTDADDASAAPVAIVNQAFAKRFFQGANPVGRKIRCWGQWLTVVGMVGDARYFNITEAARPHFFAPFRQHYANGLNLYFFLRTDGDTGQVAAAFRQAVTSVDPNVAGFHVMSLRAWTEVTLLPQKVAASLLAGLGLIALLLAAVGLYSVMAYAVSQRTQEIGIRMALGARPADVLGAVLRQGLTLTACGLLVGVAAAFAITRLVSGMLVNVNADDPLTFLAASAFLSTVALVASYIPARRATRVDPIVALRFE